MMAGDFGKLRGRDSPRRPWLRENDFLGASEECSGNLVDGLVAQGAIDQPEFPSGEILFPESGEFPRGAGIVRAVEIDIRA